MLPCNGSSNVTCCWLRTGCSQDHSEERHKFQNCYVFDTAVWNFSMIVFSLYLDIQFSALHLIYLNEISNQHSPLLAEAVVQSDRWATQVARCNSRTVLWARNYRHKCYIELINIECLNVFFMSWVPTYFVALPLHNVHTVLCNNTLHHSNLIEQGRSICNHTSYRHLSYTWACN